MPTYFRIHMHSVRKLLGIDKKYRVSTHVYLSSFNTPIIMVRTKNRYIVVRLVPEAETKTLYIKEYQLAKCILEAVQKYHGHYGLGIVEHGFRVKYCNERTKVAIIRCLHRSYQYVTSILPLITLIGDARAKFLTIYVGATIIHCNRFIVKHQQQFLERIVGQIASAKERKDLIKRVLEFDLDN